MPRVSVVMPLYNAEKYVEETINSILRQTYGDFELVVVNDVSIDKSADIVKKLQKKDSRIKLYHNDKNYGIAYTRNRAIECSTGEFIAIMDDDDLAPDYRLKDEVEFLDTHPDYAVVGGHGRIIDAEGNLLPRTRDMFINPNYIKARFLLSNSIQNSSAMIRKDFLDKYNICYLDNMFGAEDYRFWVECSLKGKIGAVDKVMLYWREHDNGESNNAKENYAEKRKEAISQIQHYALQETGFRLSEDEYGILLKVFQEEGIIDSVEEIERLYAALQTIASQAKELRLDNAKEVVTMCRKRFGEKVGKAFFLW